MLSRFENCLTQLGYRQKLVLQSYSQVPQNKHTTPNNVMGLDKLGYFWKCIAPHGPNLRRHLSHGICDSTRWLSIENWPMHRLRKMTLESTSAKTKTFLCFHGNLRRMLETFARLCLLKQTTKWRRRSRDFFTGFNIREDLAMMGGAS